MNDNDVSIMCGGCDESILSRAEKCGAVVLGFGISNVPLVDFLLSHGVTVEVRDGKTCLRYPPADPPSSQI